MLSLLFIGCDKNDENSFVLKGTDKLAFYDKRVSGFSDFSHVFIYEVNDEKLLDRIIKEWELEVVDWSITDKGNNRPLSAYARFPDKDMKWPSKEVLSGFKNSYYKFDWQQEKYWSLWQDPSGKILYVESGNW